VNLTESKATVIYDGSCGLCSGNLKWLFRFDTLHKFEAMPYQDPEVYRKFPQIKENECQQAMHVVFPNGKVFQGSDGFREVFLRLPWFFFVGILMSIPPLPFILRKAYPVIARHRYKLGGQCEINLEPHILAGGIERPYSTTLPAAILLSLVPLLLCIGPRLSPCQRLIGMIVALFYSIKFMMLNQSERKLSLPALLVYLVLWPGMDPKPFFDKVNRNAQAGNLILFGLIRFAIGCAFIILIAFYAVHLSMTALEWFGIAALLFTIHLSFSDVLTGIPRTKGWGVARLFNNPFNSKSLHEFWSKRWNVAFIEMDRILFFKPLQRLFGIRGAIFGVFVVSGILHELAISYPAQSGWGLPFAYFILQGILVLLETTKLKIKRWPSIVRRLWTYFWILSPLPILFHGAFRSKLIVPLFQILNQRIFT
jgi:predicted DCC family thiol-disulfide oxidoreductase YuxK